MRPGGGLQRPTAHGVGLAGGDPRVALAGPARSGIYHAAVLIFTDRLTAAEARLRAVECDRRNLPSTGARTALGQAAALRVDLARIVGDLPRGVAMAQRALELLPEVESTPLKLRAVAASNRSRAYLVTGDVTPVSERLATEVIDPVAASGNRFAALTSLTSLAAFGNATGCPAPGRTTYAAAFGRWEPSW